jgi:IS5 family transposase
VAADESCIGHEASTRVGQTVRGSSPCSYLLTADKGYYDFARCRKALRKRGIKARIARRGMDSSERLGRHRWVVERTLSWLNRYRRLKVRYERRADIHQAFLDLGCALICWGYVQRFC